VNNKQSWYERAAELKGMYEYYMYGPFPAPSSERISYQLDKLEQKTQSICLPNGETMRMQARTAKLTISVMSGDKEVSFDAKVCLPIKDSLEEWYPVYLEMGFVWPGRELEISTNAYYAATRGYATICYNPVDIAADRRGREGIFYELHPYGETWETQTGVLAAWGWGA
jgi:endo-1,4-beta-xylanase